MFVTLLALLAPPSALAMTCRGEGPRGRSLGSGQVGIWSACTNLCGVGHRMRETSCDCPVDGLECPDPVRRGFGPCAGLVTEPRTASLHGSLPRTFAWGLASITSPTI